MSLSIGDQIPEFTLPATDGETYGAADGEAAATVVVFTCNHCPYALAWQERIEQVARDYGSRGVRVLAINPNDAERYPRDSFEAMKERLAHQSWPMPYLRDETQEVARAFDAKTTPDVFVFDAEGKLAYRGAPDGDYDDPAQNAAWVRDALDAVIEGRAPERAQTEPIGCSVKWKA